MNVRYTASLGNIYNYPVPADWSLEPSDFVVTGASSNEISAETGDYLWPQWPDEGVKQYLMSFGGEFSYRGDIVGKTLSTAIDSIEADGIDDWSITTFDSQGAMIASEETAYGEPIALEMFFSDWAGKTLDDIAVEFAGDDFFRGSVDRPDDDAIHGHDGNDRFVMTYGDNNSDKFNGGDGLDTAVLPSSRDNWLIGSGLVWDEVDQEQTLQGFSVTDQTRSGGNVLEVVAVEYLEFADGVWELVGGEWIESDRQIAGPNPSEPSLPDRVSSDLPIGTHSLTVIADVFGSIILLKDLTEVVSETAHVIYHAGTVFNYEDVDSFVTTVVRNDEFTAEFQSEIAESFPTQANIDYRTAVALIGQTNIEDTLLMVAGADGNYTQ